MVKQDKYTIKENVRVARGIYRMTLRGDTSAITAPGQFVNIRLDGLYLRRPISICDWDEESVTLLYKVVGHGTEKMSLLPVETELDLLTGLGNGFTTEGQPAHPLVVGGGIGLAPLYGLAKRVGECTVIVGSATKDELFYLDEFRGLGVEVVVTTDDGSEGIKGFVTDGLAALLRDSSSSFTYFYACGPMPMMRALCNACEGMDGQLSLEERMGCGFGACMGCTINTVNGPMRVCKDGPVFRKEVIKW